MRNKGLIKSMAVTLALGALLSSAPVFAADAESTTAPWGCLRMGIGRANGGMVASIAQLLGLDLSEVIAQRQQGKSMLEIAASNGMDSRELLDAVMAARKDLIQQLVADEKLTKEQADICRATMEKRIEANLNRTTIGLTWKRCRKT